MKVKLVMRGSKRENKYRLFRVLWECGQRGCEGWHSNSLSVGIHANLFKVDRELWGWAVTICGIRLHRKRAYGGMLV